jgi:uncharacterized protein (TIGR02284 family)
MENFGKQLVRLIHACEHSRERYLHGAQDLAQGELHDLLTGIADRRQEIINELRTQLESHSTVHPEQQNDMLSSLHTAWIKVKDAMSGHKDRDILESCRSADHSLLETYDEILQGEILYSDLKPLFVKQRTDVSGDYQRINQLYFEFFPPASKEL